MTAPTLTYGHGYLDDLTTFWGSTTGTADAGGAIDRTVDAARTEADHYWDAYKIKYTSGDNAGLFRHITDWDLPTTTFTHLPFPNATSAGDTYVLSDYVETLTHMAAGNATPTILYDDVLQIEAVFDNGGLNEDVYYERDITNLNTDVYTHYVLRYKCSSSNINAKVVLNFISGDQTILSAISNTDWTVASGTITAGKTVDKIQFWADDVGTDGTFYVDYDFLLLCRGVFTWPFVNPGGVSADIIGRNNKIGVPGRGGDITQHGGRPSIPFHVWGEMDTGTGWRGTSGTGAYGLLLYKAALEGDTDPWQWFTSDVGSCKVTVDRFTPSQISTDSSQLVYDLLLSEFRGSDANNEAYFEQLNLSRS